jgi:ADP-ribose pyrophosphatase YjhB (NUDIX family)
MRGWQTPGFGIRATGLILNEGRVLVHTVGALPATWWALPGGGPDFQELSHEAVVREFREELDTEVEVDRLLFVIEHIFRRRQDNRESHHIEFIYSVTLNDEELLGRSEPWVAPGTESYGSLLYYWLPLDQVDLESKLYPVCLRRLVNEALPLTPVHLTAREGRR